jgi:hypothetical protein
MFFLNKQTLKLKLFCRKVLLDWEVPLGVIDPFRLSIFLSVPVHVKKISRSRHVDDSAPAPQHCLWQEIVL